MTSNGTAHVLPPSFTRDCTASGNFSETSFPDVALRSSRLPPLANSGSAE